MGNMSHTMCSCTESHHRPALEWSHCWEHCIEDCCIGLTCLGDKKITKKTLIYGRTDLPVGSVWLFLFLVAKITLKKVDGFCFFLEKTFSKIFYIQKLSAKILRIWSKNSSFYQILAKWGKKKTKQNKNPLPKWKIWVGHTCKTHFFPPFIALLPHAWLIYLYKSSINENMQHDSWGV